MVIYEYFLRRTAKASLERRSLHWPRKSVPDFEEAQAHDVRFGHLMLCIRVPKLLPKCHLETGSYAFG